MKGCIVLGLAGLVLASGALAQEASIVGVWRSSSMGPPPGVTTVTYAPDGEMLTEYFVGSLPQGGGSGVLRTFAQYRMQGPTTVMVMFGQSEMCASGGPCGPAPPQFVPAPGQQNTFDVAFRGANQLVSADGRVWTRVQ